MTVTSILPCPVTSTVVYWECCDQCQNNCYDTPSTTAGGYIGTTTVTSYTTTTPYPEETITSNGNVIIVVYSTAAYSSPTLTASVVYQVVSGDAQDGGSSYWSLGMFLAAVATVMILL